jgi:hypothetical protein
MLATSEEMRVEHLQNNGMELVYLICSVICQPIEILLRPWYGTRYYPLPVTFFSSSMMLLLPGIMLLFSNFMGMIPLLHVPQPVGMFGLGDYARVYFLAMAVHGARLWLRMIHMERELDSEYEGPALPFFQILPKGKSFWFCRIVLEPAVIFATSIVLQDLFIAQSSLSLYLRLAALALLDEQASEAELEPLHLASIPRNIDPEIRKATIAHIARNYMQE